jgi:hypothetical protein
MRRDSLRAPQVAQHLLGEILGHCRQVDGRGFAWPRSAASHSGVVDEHVDRTETFYRRGYEVADSFFIGSVSWHCDGFAGAG